MTLKQEYKNVRSLKVDITTGEILSETYGVFTTHEERQRRKDVFEKELKENMNQHYKLVLENEAYKKLLGIESEQVDRIPSKFIWMCYKERQKLFPDLKTHDISRLVYLSTYAEYNSNILTAKTNPLEEKDIFKLMKLDRKTYNSWIETMVSNRYIKFENDYIRINKRFFVKGKLKKNGTVMMLFTDMIRELYSSLTPAEHHKMGVVFRMIPYINPYFNCLSRNPHTAIKENLSPMKLTDLAEKLGYSTKQCRRLINEILDMRFGKDKFKIADMIAMDNVNIDDMVVMFNARLFFRGNAEQYNEANRLFDTGGSETLVKLP